MAAVSHTVCAHIGPKNFRGRWDRGVADPWKHVTTQPVLPYQIWSLRVKQFWRR